MNQNCVAFDSYNQLIAEHLTDLLTVLLDETWLLWVEEESDISAWEVASD